MARSKTTECWRYIVSMDSKRRVLATLAEGAPYNSTPRVIHRLFGKLAGEHFVVSDRPRCLHFRNRIEIKNTFESYEAAQAFALRELIQEEAGLQKRLIDRRELQTVVRLEGEPKEMG